MAFEIVEPGPEDFPEAIRPVLTAFLQPRPTEERLEDARLAYDDYRLLAARVDGRYVGNVAEYAFDLTLPGGGDVPASGVTMVGVSPTHRRRGVGSALMGRLLDDAAERGDPVAILIASEGSIYGRFGFGVAAEIAEVHLDTAGSAFVREPEGVERVRIVDDPAEASAVAADVWERHRRWRPGTTDRRPWTWELMRRDREHRRDGASALFWAVHHDRTGTPDGYVAYRTRDREDHGRPRCSVHVQDLVGVDAEVEAALVRFLCDIDLIHRVHLGARPVVDPLRWRLRDPREWVVDGHVDWLWARVLHVPAAFGARRYGSSDRMVLEVEDTFRPASGGRFAIEGGPDGATCTATTESPELRLDAPAIGSLLLGTVPATLLAGAGRIAGDAAALRRADAFFASSPPPFSCTDF